MNLPNNNMENKSNVAPAKKAQGRLPKETKKKALEKAADNVIKSDGKTILSYVFNDLIKPSLIDLVYDTALGSLGLTLYGDPNGGPARNRTRRTTNHIDFHSAYDRRPRNTTRTRPLERETKSIRIPEYDTRQEAEFVLQSMIDKANDVGFVTLADMYDFSQLSCSRSYDNFGWGTNFHLNAQIYNTGAGWSLRLPSPVRK